jgi:NAD-dependent SIR2 family protein deacetylase
MAPDGDADLDAVDFSNFQIPDCQRCGGMLKPDVVFFGETVPRSRVEHAMAALDRSDAMLVLGSSLMVYSGFRFARAAAERGIPIAAVNLGTTRADPLLSLKINAPCSQSLAPWTNPVAGQSHTSPA